MESQSVHIHHSSYNKSRVHILIIPAIVFILTLYFALSFFNRYKHAQITQVESLESAVLGEQDETVK